MRKLDTWKYMCNINDNGVQGCLFKKEYFGHKIFAIYVLCKPCWYKQNGHAWMFVLTLDENELEMAKQLSVEDIVKFLQHVKLEQYATIFEEFEINGELLIQLPDNELQDMGIVSAIDRLKISVYFRQYISGIKDIPSQQSVEEVVKFLEDNKPLRQFASRFGENKIDVQLLLSASDEVMRELGVDTGVHVRLIRTKFKKLTAEIPSWIWFV